MTPSTDQLNALTNEGIISDNAVQWSDVAPCDQERALQWLEEQRVNSLKAEQCELLK